MALYRHLLLLRRLSNLHPSPFPAPAIGSSPPPALAGPLAPTGRRHFAFSTAEEAAAERRRRKRRLRIEPPLNALPRGTPTRPASPTPPPRSSARASASTTASSPSSARGISTAPPPPPA
ncbi:unnamed protein product [Urochloa humidicola]